MDVDVEGGGEQMRKTDFPLGDAILRSHASMTKVTTSFFKSPGRELP